MKIIHTADWHLGNVFHGHSRSEEHAHFLSWMLQTLRSELPDAVIIAGDVFDSPNPPASAENMFFSFLDEATAAVPGVQIVVIAGNHDSAARLAAPAALLKRHNVYVRGPIVRDENGAPLFEEYVLPLSLRTDPTAVMAVIAMPYLRTTDYPSGLTAGEGVAWFLEGATRALKKSDFRGLPTVVAGHLYASGAEIAADEHSERLIVGGQEVVDAELAHAGAAYVALGHIHKRQRVSTRSGLMMYAGSVLPMSFSERSYVHGVELVELDTDAGAVASSRRIAYTPQRALVSLPERGALAVGDVVGAIASLPEARKGDDGASWPYVEIRVAETAPAPTLMHDVQEAISSRAVRLCRVVREAAAGRGRETEKAEALENLRQLSPTALARRIYADRFGGEMPAHLAKKFSEAADAVSN